MTTREDRQKAAEIAATLTAAFINKVGWIHKLNTEKPLPDPSNVSMQEWRELLRGDPMTLAEVTEAYAAMHALFYRRTLTTIITGDA